MSDQGIDPSNFDRAKALFPDEWSARAHFKAVRWENGKFCPYGDHDKFWQWLYCEHYKCAACRGKFSIKVGTIFQNTKLPLRTWFLAIAFATDHPHDLSSTAMAKALGITQKRAWHMIERLRQAQRAPSFRKPKISA